MTFISTGSPHSFEEGWLVVDPNGLRGAVHQASALYAIIHWEDGREEEIEQNDPRFTAIPAYYELDDEDDEDDEDDDGVVIVSDAEWVRMDDEDFEEVVELFELWNAAGPKPLEAPMLPAVEEDKEAA